ncbi:uncharacterized protein N7459_000569 [Penicillium hispanicum]|uniref:uncharacterized protein n=1 Tax=Penicillium hispanicum TaxID=1080232 RepID=UPI00253FED3C|nr:uncharacterized protein N7459_000569 [Penicillium hispanicum]KAJ5594361.1 hypothetical protein N7459_000569 [Penicillium hispanicum]
MQKLLFLTFFAVSAVAEIPFNPNVTSDNPSLENAHLSKRNDLEIYEAAVTKGRQLYAELQDTLADPDAADEITIDLDTNWNVAKHSLTTAVGEDALYALSHIGISASVPKVFVKTTRKTNSGIFYENIIAPTAGLLISSNNYGSAKNPTTGLTDVAPDRWSAVAWADLDMICTDARVDPSSLRYILQDEIINAKTNTTLYIAASKSNGLGTDASGNPVVSTWTPADEEFYAALGTPNGVGSVYILKDYPEGVGRQTIVSVSAFWRAENEWFDMWVKTAPTC